MKSQKASIARKTAVIERYHLYGTQRYMVRLMYRGETLYDIKAGVKKYHDRPHFIDEDIRELARTAARSGFTHVRFVGDWERRPKPRGGAL